MEQTGEPGVARVTGGCVTGPVDGPGEGPGVGVCPLPVASAP